MISAEGIPQIAAIMGFCVAGGGYLPVLCDTLLMTEGSGLYLGGPGAGEGGDRSGRDGRGAWRREMHAEISGTIDFKEPTTTRAWSACASWWGSIRMPGER